MFRYQTRSCSLLGPVALALAMLIASFASAQTIEPTESDDADAVTVSAGIDFTNAYMLRGFRQDDSKLITSPRVDVGIAVYRGDGVLKSVRVGGGMWNSLDPGDAGTNGPSGKLWYERRFNGTGEMLFSAGLSVAAMYTAYTSPNSMFTSVKEAAVRVGVVDQLLSGGSGINPYALVAFELDTAPGVGQLDGGFRAGRYLELGASPSFGAGRIRVTVPLRVGLSLRDYYELAGTDHTFGFASVGGSLTVPLTKPSNLGRWDVHGGIEVERLGDATRVLNDGNRWKPVAALGIGWRR